MREEIEEVLGKYEKRRGEERMKEWSAREVELGTEMKRVMDESRDKRWETVRGG